MSEILFASSFEDGQPQPRWTSTADTGPDGVPRTAGVDGSDPAALPGDVTDLVVDVVVDAENPGGGEVGDNLVDGSPTTKWLTFARTGRVEFAFAGPVVVRGYALTSANDAPERDPRDWALLGSTDGVAWTAVDSRVGEGFTARLQRKVYATAGTAAFTRYRLEITRNAGGPILQLAEVRFSDGSTTTPPRTMRTTTGKGATGGYAAKSGVGFTGRKALRYGGKHGASGRGYAYNKVFEVDLPVTRTTELSYLVFPSYFDQDYASTYVAVDLAFDDGTYLSDLGVPDHGGFELSPRGQGAAKSLYTNQWNRVVASIGAAAGRRIRRILVAYDNPRGPASFGGWVDDVVVRSAPAVVDRPRPSDHVLTTRGTNSTGTFSRGNTFPATALPNGFNFWAPMTDAGSTTWFYEYARANDEDNLPRLQAFTASHQPSPWMGDRQTFQVMPSVGTPTADRAARALPFRHDNEIARAHYYGVCFENGLRAEVAPTDHAAVFRFTFTGDAGNLVFDNASDAGGLSVNPETGVVTGFSDVRSGLSVGATRLFVYGVVDRPAVGGRLTGYGRDAVTGYLRFDTSVVKTVTLRIATSLLGVDQARHNLELEVSTSDTFDAVRDRARRAWDELLGRVEVEGATEDQLVTLYSNLYRLYLYPNAGHENTGTAAEPRYRYASPVSPAGPSTPTRTGARVVDGKIFVNNGFWDTYRTCWPAYALLTPVRAGELVDGFVQHYRDGGWIPRWSSPGYADLMTGTSSDVAFADAAVAGVEFDLVSAFRAALRNATVAPPNPGVGRKGLETSVFTGYTSTATPEGMSWAVEGYLNDFGVAALAGVLHARTGDPEYLAHQEYFTRRSLDYTRLFDAGTGFFRGRRPDGTWRVPAASYDPRVWGYDYTESNGWTMAFSAPHDPGGLARLHGGREGLACKLDAFYATPETARFTGSYGGVIHEMTEARDVRMGQLAQSNQVAHHIPYLYDYAGQPWKTQEKVREVLSRLYLGSAIGQGYPGDEDNGEQSAWWLFGALGFHPVQLGSGTYAIGSPLFTKATVRLDNGGVLVVTAVGNSARNVYVRSLRVNGKPWELAYLPHAEIASGGTLEFVMGDTPSRWGADTVPPPVAPGFGPWRDLTATWTVTASRDPRPLVDDTSRTSGRVSWVRVSGDVPECATFYTLTSARGSADPVSWVLKGSDDGVSWSTVDSRTGEVFPWRQQTRPFRITAPGPFRHYLLEFPAEVELAEVELLV
ncbi:GH92 family glycosyl hydrolase [Actinosynnema sp. NPDC020468]|uniref:GH92 family glycosyl hydrolase n=1 Tax=Actinosynnema sp. NPDC020468 TaxID=3154488 RepID=UPI0034040EB4